MNKKNSKLKLNKTTCKQPNAGHRHSNTTQWMDWTSCHISDRPVITLSFFYILLSRLRLLPGKPAATELCYPPSQLLHSKLTWVELLPHASQKTEHGQENSTLTGIYITALAWGGEQHANRCTLQCSIHCACYPLMMPFTRHFWHKLNTCSRYYTHSFTYIYIYICQQ